MPERPVLTGAIVLLGALVILAPPITLAVIEPGAGFVGAAGLVAILFLVRYATKGV